MHKWTVKQRMPVTKENEKAAIEAAVDEEKRAKKKSAMDRAKAIDAQPSDAANTIRDANKKKP